MSEALKGTNVASPIVPFTTDDTYATHEAKYGKGGYRTVETKQDLLSIPEARLEEGMLAYVINDEENVHTYQYLRTGEDEYEWVKSKIGAGVTKVDTLEERESLTSDIGDLVYVSDEGAIFMKLSETYWRPMSFGIPIFTKQQEDDLEDAGKLPEDFISIPDPSELQIPTETTTYESKGRGYYLDIIFSTLRSLQAEVAKLRNSFNYGINSYTGKETAMARVVGSYDIPEEEPLWAVDEADLSYVGVNLDLNNNNTLEPSENVSIGDDYLIINGTATWTDPETGFISVDDTKLYLYLTTNSLDFSVTLTGLDEEIERTKVLDFSTMGLRRYESSKYNIMICLSRTIIDGENIYGKNFVWISVGNYVTGGAEDTGYWNPTTNRLNQGLVQLDDRYTISSVSFTNLNLYKFNGYSKYQDLSSTVDPITPTDDGYKYRVAHITIRSVKNEDELMSIKNQLPANELIYNEQTGVLWIKTSSGTVRPISGSGGQQEDDGMTKEQTKEWLEQNGIIVSDDGTEPVQLNKISDITFIHQETGKKFKFTVNSEGELVSEEIPEVTLDDRLKSANYTPGNQINNLRGFVGSLGFKEKYGKQVDPNNDTNTGKDIGLYSDRVKIGSIYSPYSQNQPSYGCSHAFIELENTGDKDFPLDGCYLHYATGTTAEGVEDVTVYHLELRGVIPAGGTYLIRGKQYSDFDQANTFIKVETFDQEWYVEKNDTIELIDLTQNNNNSYLLTYGLSEVSYSDSMIGTNSGSNNSKFPYLYESHYIDSVSIKNPIKIDQEVPWAANKVWFSIGSSKEGLDMIFKNTFELDPAKQAYQSCNTTDSSRCRNTNDQDFQFLVLSKDIIEFPKSSEVFPIEKYTPKASWQHKNVCTDKTKLNKNKPNMVTVSFGINMYTTRCFNWISCGYFDEFIWIRREGQTEWEARFESYKATQENDDYGESEMRKKQFGTFHNHTVSNENYPIQNVIYNRISGTFPADGTKYTAHKCIIDVVQEEALTGKVKYEYVVGRADKNLNPDPEHTSQIQSFTLYSKEYTPRIFQVTDQQGFHWIEYQVWSAAAEEVNKTINEITEDPNSKIMPVLINTGDMTQNGTRINEWYDYYTGGYCLFNHLEQANVVGNNDLCNTNPEELGTGDDYGKSNGFYFHVFYCYEIDENILPIISNSIATKYIPSLYYFQDKDYRFVMLNTEITTINCNDWFGQRKEINGVSHTVNVYTGWTIRNTTSELESDMVYDNSFTTIYSMIYSMLNTQKDTIVACHEMPFTVVTNANLKIEGSTSPQEIDRSLNGSNNGALVGCHCNRLSNLDVKGIYWLSRLLEYSGIKLCIGGHKHTYACTNPVREFYYYDDNGTTKNSVQHGKMTMGSTLENDSAIWETNLNATDNTGLNYTIGGSGSPLKFNTTKFPIMVDTNSGVNMPDSSIYFPYYGVSEFPGAAGDKNGVVYFMCQATGYKLKSNKELPSNNQRFSYVIPKTNNVTEKPSSNQLFPMFSEIELNGNKSYTIYLYRIRNIMISGGKFSQTEYSTEPTSYNWLKGNEQEGSEDKIYGNWGYNVKTALITIS